MGRNYVIIPAILKELAQKADFGVLQVDLFGSLIQRLKPGFDIETQIDDDVQRGNDIESRHTDSG